MREELTGIYEKTESRNEKTGYCIFQVSPSVFYPHAENGILHCEGMIGFYVKGTPISLTGEWKSGFFHVVKDSIPHSRKEDVVQILEYLTGELTLAQEEKIAEAAKPDLFAFVQSSNAKKIIENITQKEKLAQYLIKKISALCEQESFTKEMLSYGIPFDRIDYLIKKGTKRENLLKNPYLPCIYAEVPIRFADLIAFNSCGIDSYNIVRICGFIVYALKMSEKQGDTCCHLTQLCRSVNYWLANSVQPVKIGIGLLWMCLGKIKKIAQTHIIDGQPYVYLNDLWDAEEAVINGIIRLSQFPVNRVCHMDIQKIEKEQGIVYRPMQRKAFNLLKTSGIKILTGPPGSGKTAVVKGLISAYREETHGEVRLSATTGCAAQVLGSACHDTAETVNRMIQVIPYGNSMSSRDLNNPVPAGLIIVDEISMIGLKLFALLLGAIKPGSILILVGDKDQLQSVECGNVLHDLIESGLIETCELTEVMRQCGTIPQNAKRINVGDELLQYDCSFQYFDCASDEELLKLLFKNYNTEKSDCQILCPVKKGKTGIWELNHKLQEKRFSGKSTVSIVYGKSIYYEGDKIIMTKTNYEKGYFNGDIGIIGGIMEGELLVGFENKKIILSRTDLQHMQLAYAITVHKSQGNEWESVHIILPDKPTNMLTRRILYTAVTRAKKRVYLYCVNQSYLTAIDNVKERQRVTTLKKKLKEVHTEKLGKRR